MAHLYVATPGMTSDPGEMATPLPAGVGRRAPILTLRDVTRRFGATAALDGASLAVRPAEVHALLGPSGSGKTSLLAVLAGLIAPTEGVVRLFGEVARRPRDLSRSVGVVQAGDGSFYPRLSAVENLVFFARLHGLRRREAAALAHTMLDEMDLATVAETPATAMSPAMRKRLAVARAMLTDPAVVVLDEATRDLDPEEAHAIRVLVSLLAARGTAVVWATQHVDEIRGFADTVTFLEAGAVRYSGSLAGLIARGRPNRFVLRLRGTFPSGPMGRALLQRVLHGTATVAMPRADDPEHVVLEPHEGHTIGDAIAALAQGGFVVLACRRERSDLEESFLELELRGAE